MPHSATLTARRTLDVTVNQNILEMEYAVRGPIPDRAAELKRQGKTIIPCNIGNPQALGQKPITFYRQVLGLIEDPSKIDRERRLRQVLPAGADGIELIPEDVLDLTESIRSKMEINLGAYSESKGYGFVREAIAGFIDRRDGVEADGSSGMPADPDNIFITNGASDGAKYVIELLISDPDDGILIPVPQYPLYSAAIKKSGGTQVNYYPDEDQGWSFDKATLEASLKTARQRGVRVKGIVVINPGNPTGGLLGEETIADVIDFAAENDLIILADEVYQENVYGGEFVSFAKVLGQREVPLFSLHSTSKGFYGECGHRGGYLEVRNPPKALGSRLTFLDILTKQASVSLCSNTVGQVLVYLMVHPPAEGSDSFERFQAERALVLDELYAKAQRIREGFQEMDSLECFGKTGGMYLFPRLNKLPAGTTDFDYCMSLLEETGLCTVNGSGFGQKEGTHHLRIAFLPPREQIEEILPRWIEFHNRYVG